MSIFNPDSISEMLAATEVRDIKGFHMASKPWGQEIIVHVGPSLVFKYIEVHEGKRTSLQYHVEKVETICVFSAGVGAGIEVEGQIASFSEPCLILPGVIHRAIGPVKFLEVSTNHLDDVVRVEDDYGRQDPR